MDAQELLEIRKPLSELEGQVVERDLARPQDVSYELMSALRYVLSFARLTVVRTADGSDVEVAPALAAHRWRVLEALRPHLSSEDDSLWGAVRVLPELVEATRQQRTSLLQSFPIDRDSLEAEVCERQLVMACGGGGGGGYGYAGAFTLFDRHGLQPELLAGTSIGSLMSIFRARHRVFEGAPMLAAGRSLSWSKVFRVLDIENKYGLPGPLRLYLRAALGAFFQTAEGLPLTFRDLELPMLVVVTGLTVEALKHDMNYYEHYMDDVLGTGSIFRPSGMSRMVKLVGIFKELMAEPQTLREIVFGSEEATMDVDVLDATGFSAAVTGLIHYDVLRDDQRTRHLLDALYAEYGITRLTEGGVVNNLPVRPAFAEVMSGRIGRRNPFVVALDCFSARPSSLVFYPIQQLVQVNVRQNIPFADFYHALGKRLSPVNLVPSIRDIIRAMHWTMDELEPRMPYIKAMCSTLPVLPDRVG